MKVQTFRDGERFIIVLEGIDVKMEEVIKGILNPLVPQNLTRECQVEPMDPPSETPPVIPVVFEDGPFAGKSPEEVLFSTNPKDGFNAYKYICSGLESQQFNTELSKTCEEQIRKYVRLRFATTNGEDYANALSGKQVQIFFDSFDYSIPQELKTKNKDDVAKIIEYFKAE